MVAVPHRHMAGCVGGQAHPHARCAGVVDDPAVAVQECRAREEGGTAGRPAELEQHPVDRGRGQAGRGAGILGVGRGRRQETSLTQRGAHRAAVRLPGPLQEDAHHRPRVVLAGAEVDRRPGDARASVQVGGAEHPEAVDAGIHGGRVVPQPEIPVQRVGETGIGVEAVPVLFAGGAPLIERCELGGIAFPGAHVARRGVQ